MKTRQKLRDAMGDTEFKALQKSTGMDNLKHQPKAAMVPSTRKDLQMF